MASEKYANNAATTLAEALDDSETGVDVTSAASFPAVGQFRIKVGSEIMLVTSVSSNTFTVTRGAESTTPAAHDNGAAVTHILTKAALDQIIADNNQSVAYASLPAAEKAGRQILTTNGLHIHRDTGAAIESYRHGRKITIPPLSSAFTWLNQDDATIADNLGTLYLEKACNQANSVCGMYKSVSAPYTLTVHFNPRFGDQNYSGYGLFWRQASDGKLVSAQSYMLNGWVFGVRKWTDETTFNDNYTATTIWQRPVEYMRLVDDSTNRKVFISADGINWTQMHTVGRTDFLTADQIGFAIFPEKVGGGTTLTQGFSIDDWTQV